MSQHQATDLVIDPFTTSGQQLAVILNRLHDAYASMHSGAARPPYAKVGLIWLDTSTAPGKLMWYDGTTDHELITKAGGGGGGLIWEPAAAATVAVSDHGYMVDTTAGSVTITAPAGPQAGDRFGVLDAAGKFGVNKAVVDGGGSPIMGVNQAMDLVEKNRSIVFVFSDATNGWRIETTTPC